MMKKEQNLENSIEQALTIPVVMWRFLTNWLHPKCCYCKNGRLFKIETYHYKPQMDIDIYRCNNCKNRVGVNAT
jgi:hypothetical protein